MNMEEIQQQIHAIQRELAANGPLVNEESVILGLQLDVQELTRALVKVDLISEEVNTWITIRDQLQELTLQLQLELDIAKGKDSRRAKLALERWYQQGEHNTITEINEYPMIR